MKSQSKTQLPIVAATGVTAFTLVLLGGLVARWMEPRSASAAGQPNATTQALLVEREATYRQLLATANAQLQQAYAEQQALRDQLQTLSAAPQSDTDGDTQAYYAITVDQAIAIASQAAKGATPTRSPDLVSFNTTPAYEITFERGVVYVDANTGQILQNTIVADDGYITADQAAQIAVTYAGGGTATGARLGQANGLMLYEITLNSGAQIYVDATTGQVVFARTRQHQRP